MLNELEGAGLLGLPYAAKLYGRHDTTRDVTDFSFGL